MSKSAGHNSFRGEVTFTIPEMYDLIRGGAATWGLEGYRVPNIPFDPAKKKFNDDMFLLHVGKKKRGRQKPVDMKAKRANIYEDIKKKSLATPGPWQYDIKTPWVQGKNTLELRNVPAKSLQKMKFKWKGKAPGDEEILKPEPLKPGKLDMSASKRTFIDQIVTQNKKKDYPLPGPGSAFHDKKSAKVYDDDEVRSLVEMRQVDQTKKMNTSKAARAMTFVDEKYQKMLPGPGSYYKKDKDEKKKDVEKGKKFKVYQKFIAEQRQLELEKIKAERERVKEATSKIKGNLSQFPLAIPGDFMTFDRYQIKYGSDKDRQKARSSKVRGKGFGGIERFAADELQKWKKICQSHNDGMAAVNGRQIDPKKDSSPGPAQYCIINGWEGKKTKVKRLNKGQFPPIFKKISHGPELNIYYSHN